MENFLGNLNKEQLEAVTQTEGPMLIIAGAGTGKTKVITSRILYLLLNKEVPSTEILALTFTDKATEEMIERVDVAMPFSYEEVAIKTFHSFCESLLRERGIEIGIDCDYKILNQTKQWLFLKKNLYEFELDYFRPLGNPSKLFFDLLNHFSRLKDEDIAPEEYLNYAEKLEKTSEESIKSLEIAKAYKTYQELMIKENSLDFGDLQYYALRLLEKRKTVLKDYQNRYKYILVDEFQDTNFAQNKLITMLANQHKNLTVVGDDDQSIYKWRGASLSNILNFEKDFPESEKIVLIENYRSTQNILDASYHLIKNNDPYRLEAQENIDKKLRSQKGEGEKIEVLHFNSYLEEAKYIAEKIKELMDSGNYNFKDFAILTRTNQNGTSFAEALEAAGIPFSIKDTKGLLYLEEIKDLLALMRFLVRPQDDIAFFRLLSLSIFNIPMSEILDLTHKAKQAEFEPIFFYLGKSFQILEEDQTIIPGFEERKAFEFAYKLFDDLLDFSRNHSASRILGEFLDKSGYYKSLTDLENLENVEKIEHIAKFLEIARDFENEGREKSLQSFMEYLQLIDQAREVLTPLPTSESDKVSISTVHSAKGLEFAYVFLPSLVAQRFPAINKSEKIEIPSELIKEDLPSKDMHLQEERRLFYTACTRAREKLFLSYSDFYEGRKKWKMSGFVKEILDSGKADLLEFGNSSLIVLKEEKNLINKNDLLINFVPEVKVNQLSYSRLDTFATCPLKYKFRYLFQIPSPSAHAANFGSSVHNTVNEFYVTLRNGVKPSLEMLLQLYEKNWISAGYESKAHMLTRKKKGREVTTKFYEIEEKNNFKIPIFLERNFRLKIGDISFTGRIDRIDKLNDGSYEVIDYKTGTSKKNSSLQKDLQLSLYAIACKEVFKIPVSKLSLYFLEDGTKVSTQRKDEDLAEVRSELIKLSEELKKSDFAPTPGFHCSFCEYRILCSAAE